MNIDVFVTPERKSLSSISEELDLLMIRLKEIIDYPVLTSQLMVEITTIYNNVAYVFLYLEANDDQIKFQQILHKRDLFYKNPDLDRIILSKLRILFCDDYEVEQSRLEYIAQLEDKLTERDPIFEEEARRLKTEAKSALQQVSHDQALLLNRLGLPSNYSNPSAVWYKLVSTSENPGTREKLSSAWLEVRDKRQSELVAIIDRMVWNRQNEAVARGYTSVLDRTLKKCRVGSEAIETFLEGYLTTAIKRHVALEEKIKATLSVSSRPMDHFPYFMRFQAAGVIAPLFALEECLDYIFRVAECVFGLKLQMLSSRNPEVLVVEVSKENSIIGTINFDLWDSKSKEGGVNHTLGIKNRANWGTMVQRPAAYVSCRFRNGEDGRKWITFQNVHSFFHEFGHSINHLLIKERIPNISGLEYLPLERLEYLSMWFEKWVYHKEMASFITIGESGKQGLELCQRIKKLEYQRTYVERGITALLDFEMHRSPNDGLELCYRRLDDRFGVSKYSSISDFPAYYTWPMFIANPGANFVYLWGSAASCETFIHFKHLSLEDIRDRNDLRECFKSCFKFDLQSEIPDSNAIFSFYEA